MMWIVIALAAYFFWGLVNIGDKYIITNKIKNPYVYLVLLTASGLLSLLLIPFVNFFIPELKWLLWLLLSASFYFFGSLPYVKAVSMEDITRINIWWNLIPVLTLVIAWLTINEHLTNSQMLAFVILIVGSVIASIHIKQRNISFSKAFPWMILAVISYSIYAVIIRYVTQSVPFVVTYICNALFMTGLSFSLFLSSKFRKDFKRDVFRLNKKVVGIMLSIAIFDELALMFNMWALSLGSVALVYALEGSQTIFVFLLVVLISLFKPKILKEEIDKYNIILKIGAICLIVVGVVMVNLS